MLGGMSTTPLPPEFKFGHVAGRFALAVADTTADEDPLPELRGMTGAISFTPRTEQVVSVSEEPTLIVKTTMRFSVDSAGRLSDAHGNPTVVIPVGVYTVSYDLKEMKRGSHQIEVTEEHTAQAPYQLVLDQPYVPPAGAIVQTLPLPAGRQPGQVLGTAEDGSLVWVEQTGGEGGTTDHAELTNRDEPDQHPISSVTGLQGALDGKQAAGNYAAAEHAHDDRYYTESEVDTALAGKADTGHDHDGDYFTETESDARFVRTVNGTGPDGAGNVAVSGGGDVSSFLPPVGGFYPLSRMYTGGNGLAGAIGTEYAQPIRGGFSVDAIVTRIWTGVAGLTARVGIYADDNGSPAATVTAELGVITLSVNGVNQTVLGAPYALPQGRWWLSIVQQGDTAASWTQSQQPSNVIGPSPDFSGITWGFTRTGITGPLPTHTGAWSTVTGTWNTNLPAYSVRRSA